MPDGVVRWVDTKDRIAEIVRGGRVFRARVGDVEPGARHGGAHVHFDIRRADGQEQAVQVTLRQGTRVSRRQHRFGTLVGARSADARGAARVTGPHPELAGAKGLHPLEVARAWATCVATGDVDGALALYAPDAVVHLADGERTGRHAVQAWLESVPVLGCARHARVRGADGTVAVRWDAEGDEPGLAVRCQVAHHAIAEQWEAAAGPSEDVAGAAPSIALTTVGPVEEQDVALASRQLRDLVAKVHASVLFARLKLSWEPDPARERPAVAEATLDLSGDLVRAHVTAPTMAEAVDLLGHRVRDRLEHLAKHRRQLRQETGQAAPGTWRHGDLPMLRPRYFDRPVQDREVVRHKTFAVDELTPDEAVFDMEQLDYDFYLFRDLASDTDSLIERAGDSYRLTRLSPVAVDPGPTAAPVDVAPVPAPMLTLAEAIERLDAGGEPHVFFAEAATGRGTVVYRRYDGHYGVITPQ
ncbi:MAG TPA: sigma 54 modulation/S30EA ribosomal C-terminal domain-containing protein [Acidimicrobiales bacterium]|nr:sigma 54 modulation/S30EA ribosomal C-terminal domain-containing protein [Acidimicrobiales bacterium]